MLPPLKYEYVTSADRLPHIAQEITDARVIALDLETTGLSSVHGAEIRLCSINTGRGIYVIDVFQTKTLGPVAVALNNPNGLVGAGHPVVVGQNIKFDQKFLLFYHGIELWPVFDTFRASQLMWNGNRVPHDLWSVQEREINERPRTEDLGGSNWSSPVLTQQQKDYAADDVTTLPLIREVQKGKLTALGLNQVALIEFGAILPESAVELNGFYLNSDAWLKLAAENETQRNNYNQMLQDELEDPTNQFALPGMRNSWNVDSSSQMLVSLRRKGLKIEDTKEMTLAMLSSRYPIIDKILLYREYAHAVKTYGKKYVSRINPLTGRIHPEYFGFLAAGRYACLKPNLSAVPRAKPFRYCFQAENGYVFVLADYSGIEMRIVAEVAGDPTLMRVFQENKDVHKVTSSFLLGVPYEQITKAQKQQAKPVNFGFCYGMMPPKMVLYAKANYRVDLSLKQATEFRDKYMENYSTIPRWHERSLRDGKRQKMVTTLTGRLRHLEEDAHNEILNTPIQGLGADGLKAALRNVYFRLKKLIGHAPVKTVLNSSPDSKMVHHVHDEIITENKKIEGLPEAVKHELEKGMEESMQQFLKRVPVVAEGAIGATWADKS